MTTAAGDRPLAYRAGSQALCTDLYELTMMAGYELARAPARATFELFVRELPPHRAFLIAAGLEQALNYLEDLSFTSEDIAFLRGLPNLRQLPARYFDDVLPRFRFSGDVWAMPEGTPVFPFEPILRVTAPLAEAQVVETALLSCVTFQTSIASKAIRIVEAARGRQVMEFGSRRAHGIEAGILAARAAFVAGCVSTSNVEAGRRFDIPLSGTMAHSWVMSFPDELSAFRAYAELFGDHAVLLIDTYDTLRAARLIVSSSLRPAAVRIDSGDLLMSSRAVRSTLDAGGRREVKILVSGDLDEHRIAALLDAGAPIDGFGVGTALATSSDAPALGGVYKLVELESDQGASPVMKLSASKRSHPGRKQVWRRVSEGRAVGDTLGLADETRFEEASASTHTEQRPLMQLVMRDGRRVHPSPPLRTLAAACARAVEELPPHLKLTATGTDYPVELSAALALLTEATTTKLAALH